jgi:ABC-type multidrug transport system permease subunit
VEILGPFVISGLLLLLQGFCGMSYGLAISSVSDNEIQVLELAIATIFPSLLLSGIIWPVEGMPKWIRLMTNISPLTHTAEAMRSVASRGWGITHFKVWFGLATVSAWSVFFNVLAAIIFTFRQQ